MKDFRKTSESTDRKLERIFELEERIAYLEDALGLKDWHQWVNAFRMTPCQARIFNLCMKREIATNASLIAAWDGEISLDSIKCHMVKVRRKIYYAANMHIETVKLVGYRMSPVDKEKARAFRDAVASRASIRASVDASRQKANGARA